MIKKPWIGIPIGDPAGVGPEIALKACLNPKVYEVSSPVLIGNQSVLEEIIKKYQLPLKTKIISLDKNASFTFGEVNLIEVDTIKIDHVQFGKIDKLYGSAAFEYIKVATTLAMQGFFDALATTPINKEALKLAEIPYIGHTEILSDLTQTKDPLTMFEIDQLRVFFLSRHVSLKQAIDLVKKDRIMVYIEKSLIALKRLGIEGTLAIAGLNPHSGDGGLFGMEEILEIIPAVKEMQKRGFKVVGPIPADSVFALGLQGRYEAILSLYHDQGHIATKTYNFQRTISITNNMPFLRTSVDHGTAMDIAGKNLADESSMVEAILLAAKYAIYFQSNIV